jgi:3-oxoacyl-[acyl-carrier protein] reductase
MKRRAKLKRRKLQMDFKNKVVIVTGGGRDIGKACALRMAENGAKVAITYHESAESAAAIIDEIEANGGKAIAVKADLTKQEDVDRVVSETRAAFGDDIHSLVHVTGGLLARKTVSEMDVSFWNKVMDVNLGSLFMTCKAVIPFMPEGGSIVTFASLAGRDGGGGGAVAYATSKGAIMTFTRGLAKELGPNIRVNSVCPGMIDTKFHDSFTKPEVRKNVAAGTAAKREGSSDEVANLACFLASDEASYMSGNCVDINGGINFS